MAHTLNGSQKEVLHVKRPCILVADLERSLSLYRDLLEFRLDYVGDASADSYLYKVFKIPSSAKLRFATLSTEREDRALALTEVKGIELPKPSTMYSIAIVLQVNKVEPLIEAIKKMNLNVIEPSHFTAPPNLHFTEQGFYDFDNRLIVLYDVRESKGDARS